MQRLQAFKFELRPDGQQQRQMRRFSGACRFVFNRALALRQEGYERGEKKVRLPDHGKMAHCLASQ